MTKHCKNCLHHHNAGHKKDSPNAKYNDWCCKYGKFAGKAEGQCKLSNGRVDNDPRG